MSEGHGKTYLTLAEAARLLPSSKSGRPVSIPTIWRWCVHGINGVRLEHLRFGKRIVVTAEALDAFGKALAEAATLPREPRKYRPRARTPEQRARAIEAARKALREK